MSRATAIAKSNRSSFTDNSVEPARIELHQHVPALCLSLGGKLALHAKRHSAKDLGLDLCEWRIVQVLGASGRATIFYIADQIAMDRGGTSRAVARLEDRRYVERQSDPADRRKSCIALTEKGWHLHNAIVAFSLAREERLLSGFSQEERVHLRKFLNHLIDEAETIISEQWTPE